MIINICGQATSCGRNYIISQFVSENLIQSESAHKYSCQILEDFCLKSATLFSCENNPLSYGNNSLSYGANSLSYSRNSHSNQSKHKKQNRKENLRFYFRPFPRSAGMNKTLLIFRKAIIMPRLTLPPVCEYG